MYFSLHHIMVVHQGVHQRRVPKDLNELTRKSMMVIADWREKESLVSHASIML